MDANGFDDWQDEGADGAPGDGAPGAIWGEVSAPPPAPAHQRRSERRRVALDAGLRRPQSPVVNVRIMDLSIDGFCIETHLDLAPGADVWLRLPGLEARLARVAWMKGSVFGCAFAQPLHPAVLDMVVSRARP